MVTLTDSQHRQRTVTPMWQTHPPVRVGAPWRDNTQMLPKSDES